MVHFIRKIISSSIRKFKKVKIQVLILIGPFSQLRYLMHFEQFCFQCLFFHSTVCMFFDDILRFVEFLRKFHFFACFFGFMTNFSLHSFFLHFFCHIKNKDRRVKLEVFVWKLIIPSAFDCFLTYIICIPIYLYLHLPIPPHIPVSEKKSNNSKTIYLQVVLKGYHRMILRNDSFWPLTFYVTNHLHNMLVLARSAIVVKSKIKMWDEFSSNENLKHQ